ncbi:hypothetical protein HY339_01820 [Candidatus Gottesmanbacteria bacterium]|nr:hypothetical protein [Candidatus Gottesmanbacteria bacterium]
MAFPGFERTQARLELPVIPCLTLAAVLKLPELRIDSVVRVLAGFRPILKLKLEFRRPVPADSEARSLGLDLRLKLAMSLDRPA